MADPTREELIALCESARVPQSKWGDRDSQKSQVGIGTAWALLSAGCEFNILREGPKGLDSDDETWWIEVFSEDFGFWESFIEGEDDRRDYLHRDTFYIPTAARLDNAKGEDWY